VKILSWNVNGLRAVLKKGFLEFLEKEQPDILGLQETKLQEHQIPPELLEPFGYKSAWSFAERKGYSGTAVYYRPLPSKITTRFDVPEFNGEGRVIQLEYDSFTLLNVYFPNGQMSDERLRYKMAFYDACLQYCDRLREGGKKLIVMGDYNTAHTEIDLAHPKANAERSGFLPEERAWIDTFIAAGYRDAFRLFHPEPERYTWWTYRLNARENNVGWRIDYFFASDDIVERIEDSTILDQVMGSDHCPIGLILGN